MFRMIIRKGFQLPFILVINLEIALSGKSHFQGSHILQEVAFSGK